MICSGAKSLSRRAVDFGLFRLLRCVFIYAAGLAAWGGSRPRQDGGSFCCSRCLPVLIPSCFARSVLSTRWRGPDVGNRATAADGRSPHAPHPCGPVSTSPKYLSQPHRAVHKPYGPSIGHAHSKPRNLGGTGTHTSRSASAPGLHEVTLRRRRCFEFSRANAADAVRGN